MIKKRGFTLVELMVAMMIFAIISLVAYRIISALVKTKQVVSNAQVKWSGLANAFTRIGLAIEGEIPLVVRDANGKILPAVIGSSSVQLLGPFDAQLELTVHGSVGDPVYGTVPPHRLGFRFVNDTLYEVRWPVLNRVLSTVPQVDILLSQVGSFTVSFLYPDKEWRDTWPLDINSVAQLPLGIKVRIIMQSGEEVERQWSIP